MNPSPGTLSEAPWCPPAGARVEEFLYEKLDRKVPSRVTNGELLAQYMAEAANDFGPGTPYGKSAWLMEMARESIPSQKNIPVLH